MKINWPNTVVSDSEPNCAQTGVTDWLRDTVPASIEHSIQPVDYFGYGTEQGSKSKRAKEYAAGRYCAQQSLIRLNENRSVGRAEDRAPVWPQGFVGSISHSSNWVWAAAASSSSIRSVGVDTELIVDHQTFVETREQIGSDEDWMELATLELEPESQFTVLFSAKEAFYKCWYPVSKEYFDFIDVSVDSAQPGQLTLRANQSNPIFGSRPASIAVHYFVETENVFTVTWMAEKA